MSQQGSAFPEEGCAKISGSTGHGARMRVSPHLAGRSNPMTGIDRSKLSCRTLLLLFVSLGAPLAARSATLDESARELARKVAASLVGRSDVCLEMRNSSSLTPEEVARVEQALDAQLQSGGIRVQTDGGTAPCVVVTLSENLKSFVWTAEIRQGDAPPIFLATTPRPPENRIVSRVMPMKIRGEKYWEGPERILDASVKSDASGQALYLLLLPDGLAIQNSHNNSVSNVEILSAQSSARDPRGILEQIGNSVLVLLQPKMCSVALDTFSLIECHSTEGPARAREPIGNLLPHGQLPAGKGTESGMFQSMCGVDQILVTGRGDYTQSDSVQAFQMSATSAVPISDEFNFSGPVIALHATTDTPRAIVHNLQTGNYEAYRILVSCGQ
jgi:hypothetical protein